MYIAWRMWFTYPKLSLWIYTNIPTARFKPKIFAAFIKYSEQNFFKSWLALGNGTNPAIDFRNMPDANGEFEGATDAERVFLSQEICDKFENSAADAKDPRMHILLESTILHEMVHWGDWKDGVDQPPEEGKEFEKAAYGKDINRYW